MEVFSPWQKKNKSSKPKVKKCVLFGVGKTATPNYFYTSDSTGGLSLGCKGKKKKPV